MIGFDANTIEIISIAVFFLSLYGLMTSTNIIKSIVFVSVMETAVIMFFLGLGYQTGLMPPIGVDLDPAIVADPLPQAFMITAVVIGICSTAVNIVVFLTIFRKYRTTSWDVVKKKNMEHEIC